MKKILMLCVWGLTVLLSALAYSNDDVQYLKDFFGELAVDPYVKYELNIPEEYDQIYKYLIFDTEWVSGNYTFYDNATDMFIEMVNKISIAALNKIFDKNFPEDEGALVGVYSFPINTNPFVSVFDRGVVFSNNDKNIGVLYETSGFEYDEKQHFARFLFTDGRVLNYDEARVLEKKLRAVFKRLEGYKNQVSESSVNSYDEMVSKKSELDVLMVLVANLNWISDDNKDYKYQSVTAYQDEKTKEYYYRGVLGIAYDEEPKNPQGEVKYEEEADTYYDIVKKYKLEHKNIKFVGCSDAALTIAFKNNTGLAVTDIENKRDYTLSEPQMFNYYKAPTDLDPRHVDQDICQAYAKRWLEIANK